MEWIESTLTLVSKHKEQCEKDKQLLLTIASDTNPNCFDYFQLDVDWTSKESHIAMSHLLTPGAKVLSKSKGIHASWFYSKIVPLLCKEVFDNKESCLWIEVAPFIHVSGGEQHGEEMDEMDEIMIKNIENNI